MIRDAAVAKIFSVFFSDLPILPARIASAVMHVLVCKRYDTYICAACAHAVSGLLPIL